jgi:peptidoglycan hydrolase-like protein with peptidoglycan-binding domain
MATAPNPNRTYITDEMWWLWLACLGFIPGVRLGGIYANKSGYHNTVLANLAKWPGNYSIRYAIDRRDPKTKARAIDLTMNSTWMRIITQRLLDGAARRDPRMRCVKEFYGTVDGRTVVGRIKDSEDGPYRSASSDASHTWHEHVGLLTPYVDDREAMEGLASLLKGESLDSWRARTGSTVPSSRIPAPPLREDDSGPRVATLQGSLNEAVGTHLIEDGYFGPHTTAAVTLLQQTAGIEQDGIYGTDSANALRDLLEDDMPLSDADVNKIRWSIWSYTNENLTTMDAYAHLRDTGLEKQIRAEQATHTALLKQLLAGQSDLTESDITAAVAEGVRQAIPSPEELAAAVAAAVDHDLDTAAVTEALREVLGSLDGTAA